jgi:hypothetical protein
MFKICKNHPNHFFKRRHAAPSARSSDRTAEQGSRWSEILPGIVASYSQYSVDWFYIAYQCPRSAPRADRAHPTWLPRWTFDVYSMLSIGPIHLPLTMTLSIQLFPRGVCSEIRPPDAHFWARDISITRYRCRQFLRDRAAPANIDGLIYPWVPVLDLATRNLPGASASSLGRSVAGVRCQELCLTFFDLLMGEFAAAVEHSGKSAGHPRFRNKWQGVRLRLISAVCE